MMLELVSLLHLHPDTLHTHTPSGHKALHRLFLLFINQCLLSVWSCPGPWRYSREQAKQGLLGFYFLMW